MHHKIIKKNEKMMANNSVSGYLSDGGRGMHLMKDAEDEKVAFKTLSIFCSTW
jgi:hypothetical protein